MFAFFGYLSGFFAVIEYIPYIRDIFLKKTKPHRATFFIWSVLGGIAFFSQLAKGATHSLWLPGLETATGLVVFMLSIKYGVGGYSKQDKIALFVAGLGLVAWYVTKDAAVALYITIFIDAVGNYLTIHKSFHMPESETTITWIISALSGLFAMLAVGKFDIILLSYPFYIVIANSAVVIAIQLGKQRKLVRE